MTVRPLELIKRDFNMICVLDEFIIDQMLLYREQDIPKTLINKHQVFTKKLKELDEERNFAIVFYHNFYRRHYAMVYPHLVNQSLAKQNKTA